MEETKRFYNEELPDEEEAEFTDPDTSDCEFVQEDEGERESDACSDLDKQEGVEVTAETCDDVRGASGDGVDGEEGESEVEREEGEGEEEEEEMEGYSAGEESDGSSDNEDNIQLATFSRAAKKKKKKQLLDSDDEEETAAGTDGGSRSVSPLTSRGGCKSDTLGGSGVSGVMEEAGRVCEEASMGPLLLNESFEKENAANTCTNGPANEDGSNHENPVEESTLFQVPSEGNTLSQLAPNDAGRPVSSVAPADGCTDRGSAEVAQQDTNTSEQYQEDHREEEEEGEEEEEEEGKGDPTQAIPDSDRDNSLESSLLWAPSLAPAQPWPEGSVDTATCGGTEGGGGEGSQWPGFSQRYQDTQNASIDDETQLLDANGYVHVHVYHTIIHSCIYMSCACIVQADSTLYMYMQL